MRDSSSMARGYHAFCSDRAISSRRRTGRTSGSTSTISTPLSAYSSMCCSAGSRPRRWRMAAFPSEEYEKRLVRTRVKMGEAGVDVLLVTDPANMNYLTGYDAWSFYVPQAVIVPLKPEPPLWVGRGMDAQSAILTTTLPRENILSYADDYVESAVKHPMEHVASVLADGGFAASRIGYEGNAYFFTARNLQVLTRAFRQDTATCLELSGCRQRYHCAMSRTVYLGSTPNDMERVAAATGDGMAAALATVKPGALCQDVELAWRQTINRAGFSKPSRIGYSIGLNYPPNWADHTASLRENDTTVMEPNMTFHLMLGMWMEGWGFELSDTFRVTETGHEVLADFPRQLFVKA